jgi:hypothetical protein
MRWLVLLVVLALPAHAGADPALVVADCQVRALEGERWLVRLRSTAAQAFDVSRDGGDVVVRLHGARAGDVVPPAPAAFGAITISEDAGGVVVRVVPSDAGWRVTAEQGGSANEVEVRIGR